ncbi:MAG: YceI family protein [Candidatus Eremiobacteraeota bacterium]|nr:YceI family protein [Candidatus Eremiobacteraeota bacterium]
MAKWFFEPGHTEAEFKARHMMVTWVRGLFKNIDGTLDFDPARPELMSFQTQIEARTLWTGVQQRDDHLRSADFLDVEHHPYITYKSTAVRPVGETEYVVDGDLTIRDTTKNVPLHVTYLGQWDTPWWEDGVDKGPKRRAGFAARARINRYDFGVNWNDVVPRNGIVVSEEIEITIDVEAIHEE